MFHTNKQIISVFFSAGHTGAPKNAGTNHDFQGNLKNLNQNKKKKKTDSLFYYLEQKHTKIIPFYIT